jgi:hypothetical protein
LNFQQSVPEDSSSNLIPLEKSQMGKMSEVIRSPRSKALKSSLQYGFSPEKLHHSEVKDSLISKQYCSIFGEKVRPLESSPVRKAVLLGVRFLSM